MLTLFAHLALASFFSFFAATPVVVLDPGHGGRYQPPSSLYGDKYDALSGEYLDKFRPGAHYKGIWENEAMYDIAWKARSILNLTMQESTKAEFSQILKKYGKQTGNVFPIDAQLSREASLPSIYFSTRSDINAPYRLYDYPDISTSEMQKGTISHINELTPDLVVSLHLTASNGGKNGAMAAVITPSEKTYSLARRYVHASSSTERGKIQAEFEHSDWSEWFIVANGYNVFESFLCDAWIYYTGYWSTSNGLGPRDAKFRGYRHNMVSWKYADSPGWEKHARNHPSKSSYAGHLKDFKPEGAFWEREQSEPENWRREGGQEGYGGDNFYASQEILRYIRLGMLRNGVDTAATLPEIRDPYLSTWSVPTHVNAVAAYLEIAHLRALRDRKRMLESRDVYAEAIAVAIYSLFYPFEPETGKDLPRGKRIDFDKYRNYSGGNYFTSVISR